MYETDMYEGMIAETTSYSGHNGDLINAYLARPLGPGPYPELSSHKDGGDRFIQGPDSVVVKFKPTLCSDCNNRRSQPHDLAYDRFADYVRGHDRHILSSRAIDLRAVYGRDRWEDGRDDMLRFFAKHAGCRLAENGIEVPEPHL